MRVTRSGSPISTLLTLKQRVLWSGTRMVLLKSHQDLSDCGMLGTCCMMEGSLGVIIRAVVAEFNRIRPEGFSEVAIKLALALGLG